MNLRPIDIIVIRGAPGSGKTETAKRLAKHFKDGVRLEIDSLRSMVISVDWTNQEEHKQMISLATIVVSGFLELAYRPVIVIDTFSGDKLSYFLSELNILDQFLNLKCFALVTAPDVLRERVINRPDDRFKDVKICQSINSDTIKYLLQQEILIDNTNLSPDETAALIIQKLIRGRS